MLLGNGNVHTAVADVLSVPRHFKCGFSQRHDSDVFRSARSYWYVVRLSWFSKYFEFISVSGYPSQHILSGFPSPEIHRVAAGRASCITIPWGAFFYIRFWYLRCCGCPWNRGRQHLVMPLKTCHFWSRGHLRMAVVHLHIKFGAYICIHSGVIVIFPKFKMADAAILDFQIMWIWPFWRVDSVVFVLCTKFGSNICYSHWDRRIYAFDFHLMTSRELTSVSSFGHVVISAWSRCIFP